MSDGGPETPRIRRWAWEPSRVLMMPWLFGPMRFRVRGREHIPRRGGVLVVSNHVSQADPPLVGYATIPRRSYYMAKSELFRIRGLAWYIRALGAFPVVRGSPDRNSIRMARDLLARGECVIMFPEGTRTTSGHLRPGFPGAGLLGLEPGITIVPAAIWGSQHPFGPVRVRFGPPVRVDDLGSGPRGRRAQVVTDRMMAAIAALVPRVGGPAQDPPSGSATLPPRR
ncbi:MAG: 1-acyl-sn-glycerol-3-phosphate acyltransferase [Thermoleophilia bacterium]|nr:1-acyl-sn-glycerol-3-phosphate acyltransferase [Thermoleophilia bacterium]